MKFLNSILSRIVLVVLALLIQITWIVFLVLRFSAFFEYANLFLQLFSLSMVFYIAQKDSKAAFKLAWIVPILLFPLFGGLIYLLFGTKSPTQGMRRKLERSRALISQGIPDSAKLVENFFQWFQWPLTIKIVGATIQMWQGLAPRLSIRRKSSRRLTHPGG